MFGLYRLLLALLVCQAHLWGLWPHAGGYAVFAFYVLSGYLMTTIMHKNYGYDAAGIKRFALNRFLRLYPCWIAVLLLSLFVIWLLGEEATRKFYFSFQNPKGSIEWITSFTIVGHSYYHEGRIIPTGWALGIELIFYIAIAFGLSRSRLSTIIWIVLGTLLVAFQLITDKPFTTRYHTIWAGVLPFSLGSFLYHYPVKRFLPFPWMLVLLIVSAIGFAALLAWPDATFVFTNHLPQRFRGVWGLPLYLSLGFSSVIISSLSSIKLNSFFERIDEFAGRFSYPSYLLHYPVGVVVISILPQLGRKSPGMFVLATGITLALSHILYLFLEKPLTEMRARIRKS